MSLDIKATVATLEPAVTAVIDADDQLEEAFSRLLHKIGGASDMHTEEQLQSIAQAPRSERRRAVAIMRKAYKRAKAAVRKAK